MSEKHSLETDSAESEDDGHLGVFYSSNAILPLQYGTAHNPTSDK